MSVKQLRDTKRNVRMDQTLLFRARATMWWLTATLALLGAMSSERTALAANTDDETTACVDAYERGQERLVVAALIEARERFALCSRASCPSFIHEDCTRFLEEVKLEIPTVSLEVTSGNRRLAAVRILEGERVLHHGTTKEPIELDPGGHELRFEAPGAVPVTRSLVVERGEKGLIIEVDLPPLVAPVPAQKNVAALPAERKVDSAPWIVLGIGTAGVGAFALLGSMGLSEERRLERGCAPRCSASELRSLRTKYLFADVALGIGVTGLLAGGYLLLTSEPEPATRGRELPLAVEVGRHGGTAQLKGQF
jgi:hypothetical protein